MDIHKNSWIKRCATCAMQEGLGCPDTVKKYEKMKKKVFLPAHAGGKGTHSKLLHRYTLLSIFPLTKAHIARGVRARKNTDARTHDRAHR